MYRLEEGACVGNVVHPGKHSPDFYLEYLQRLPGFQGRNPKTFIAQMPKIYSLGWK